MHKKNSVFLLILCLLATLLSACSSGQNSSAESTPPTTAATEPAVTEAAPAETQATTEAALTPSVEVLPDGTYTVDFNTDSSMFHVNEAMLGKGTVFVEDGKMTVHIALVSKSILNLYVGTAEEAKKEGAVHLEPTEDLIKYKDGYEEYVYGFDVPVEKLDTDFALAIIGKKGTWYDHTVSVSNPEPNN